MIIGAEPSLRLPYNRSKLLLLSSLIYRDKNEVKCSKVYIYIYGIMTRSLPA